jgi:hypothetical protein
MDKKAFIVLAILVVGVMLILASAIYNAIRVTAIVNRVNQANQANQSDQADQTIPIVFFIKKTGCIYCDRMIPDWERASAATYAKFITVDVTKPNEVTSPHVVEITPTSVSFKVRGNFGEKKFKITPDSYPTLFGWTGTRLISYEGDRSAKSFVQFARKLALAW